MQIEFHSPRGMKQSEVIAIKELEKLRESWKGYASFLAVDNQGSMEIDLLIMTHSRIILVEIKEWSGHIDSDGRNWIQTIANNSYKHTAPTHIKREHAQRLQNILKMELEHKWGIFYVVEYAIVLSGSATIGNLAPHEKNVVYTLTDFMKINELDFYTSAFPERNKYESFLKKNKRPNDKDQLLIFENWFKGTSNKILKRKLVISGYELNFEKDTIFEHPKKLYKDIHGHHIDNYNDSALIRYWNFSTFVTSFATTEQRASIVLKESRLIRYLDKIDRSFKKDYLLEIINPISESQVTEEVIEIYNLSNDFIRLDNYCFDYDVKLEDKYEIIRAILAPIARLHDLEICHRDLSLQKLWYDRLTKSVLFSSFSIAKLPEDNNINRIHSNIRQVLCSNNIILPEDSYNEKDELTLEDSYKVDIFQLGVIVYYILFNKYPNKNNQGVYIIDKEIPHELGLLISQSLEFDHTKRYKNAGDMFIDLDKLTKKEYNIEKDDANEVLNALNNYHSNKIPFLEWSQTNVVENSNDKINYETIINNEKYHVIIWTNLRIDNNEKSKGLNRHLLEFAKRVDICKKNNLPIHKIKDFGFCAVGMYLVYSSVEGLNILSWVNNYDLINRVHMCLSLIQSINIIHDVGLWHGNLTTNNIIINEQNQIRFINFLEINNFGNQIFNTQYTHIEINNNFFVDNYAVYLISRELIPEYEDLLLPFYTNILGENLDCVPNTLDDLKFKLNDILTPKVSIPEFNISYYTKKGNKIRESFENDDDLYYCSINKKNEDNSARIYLTGRNKKLTLFGVFSDTYKINNINLEKILPSEWLSDSQNALNNKDKRSCIIKAKISFSEDKPINNEDFIKFICNLDIVSKYLKSNNNNCEINKQVDIKNHTYNLPNLWKILIETEKDFLPFVTILDKPQKIGSNKFRIDIEENIYDFQISIDDDVAVISADKDSPKYYGKLIVEKSSDGAIVIEAERKYDDKIISNLQIGSQLKFSEYKSAISWNRRIKSLQRIIDKESTISDLIHYFETPNYQSTFTPIEITPPNLDLFSVYNLDDIKKKAFLKILKDPINVIQGPPGTGKTTLLANLLDYVFRTNEIKNVLLVSQSHAAVNEVTIKFREVSKKIQKNFPDFINEEISMVRLGELSNIPESLYDIHVNYIQAQIRTKFFREFSNRLWALTSKMGLPKEYIYDCAKIFINIGSILDNYTTLTDECKVMAEDCSKFDNNDDLKNKLKDNIKKLAQLNKIISKHLIKLNINDDIIKNNQTLYVIMENIGKNYLINNPQLIRKLYNILKISKEWYNRLIVDTDNLSGFLAKSRKLVIGTLVGIGKCSYNISNIDYDLVIIDEAARASASELSLAIQSGHRILMVGDHKQLPPLYNNELIDSVSNKLSISKEIVLKTDFERLFENINNVMLHTQYRMAPPIGNLVSEVFYGGQLTTGRENSPKWLKNMSKPWNKAVSWIDTSSYSSEEGLEYNYNNGGKVNELEVDLTIEIVSQFITQSREQNNFSFLEDWFLCDGKVPPFGIITGYKKQKDLLEKKLQSTNWYNSLKHLIRIDTIDAYQGQESRLLILNLVRSNNSKNIGFLTSYSRINVALSRAKERLIIIGDKSTMGDNKNINTPLYKCLKLIDSIINDDNNDLKNEYQIISLYQIHKKNIPYEK